MSFHYRQEIQVIAAALLLLIDCCFVASSLPAAEQAEEGFAKPTFHCLGLYWSPEGGAADKEVAVRYRREGTADWHEGLPMRYHPIPDTDRDLADYRGSIVHLAPGTTTSSHPLNNPARNVLHGNHLGLLCTILRLL